MVTDNSFFIGLHLHGDLNFFVEHIKMVIGNIFYVSLRLT